MSTFYLYSSIPSTNDAAKALAREGAPDGTLVAAWSQTAGRGQGDHTFYSPSSSGLYLSRIVRMALPVGQATRITTAAAVAAARAVRRTTGVSPDVKWINDLYVGGRKVAGILTESASAPDGTLAWAVVGIGVNVFPPPDGFPPEIAASAAALLPAPVPGVREALLYAVADELTAVLPSVPSAAYADEYLSLCRYGKEKALAYFG